MLNPTEPSDNEAPFTPRFIADYLTWAWQGKRLAMTTLPLICYRGLANVKWELLPTACRRKFPAVIVSQFENEVLAEFRTRFDLKDWSDLEVLAYARHHGAPTRLLDWSRNPLVGLWFAVADNAHDTADGAIYQLSLLPNPKHICVATNFQLAYAENCKCGRPVHLFASPHRIERSARQSSVFTISSLNNDAALKSLDLLESSPETPAIRRFSVPSAAKPRLRSGLAQLGLDAFSIYGDADSLGEKLSTLFHS